MSKDILHSFSSVTGCGCMYTDISGNTVRSCGTACDSCPVSELFDCTSVHRVAGVQAKRFGGIYIYECPAGFDFSVAPVTVNGSRGLLVTGPVITPDRSDFLATVTLENGYDCATVTGYERFAASLPAVTAKYMTDMSTVLLSVSVSGLAGDTGPDDMRTPDYVSRASAALANSALEAQEYPYEKEKLLYYAIKTGNLSEAGRFMNDILGHIFLTTDYSLETIKFHAIELTVLISRAAIEGGADAVTVNSRNPGFLTEFMALSTIEDVCRSLSAVLHRLTEETFITHGSRHHDTLLNAINYIRANYMNKITLDEIASQIYISPSYLSRIFKQEINMSVNNYINKVRIERAKVMLMSGNAQLIDVAESTGFCDQSYFNKVFKKFTGVTPAVFKETRESAE